MESWSPPTSPPVKLLTFFVVFCFCVLFSWSLDRIKTQTEKDLSESLKTTLVMANSAISIWYKDIKTDCIIWAASEKLMASIKKQLVVPPVREALLSSPVFEEQDFVLKAAIARHLFLDYSVLNPDGIIIASSNKANVGRLSPVLKQSDVYTKALQGEFAISRPFISEIPLPDRNGKLVADEPIILTVTPVVDATGKVIALFCLRIDPADDFSHIVRLGRVGGTGETYAFDKNGKLVTESRFDYQLHLTGLVSEKKRSLLNVDIRDPGGDTTRNFIPKVPRAQQPLTYMAADAIAGNSGVSVKGYRDYRGVMVVGAWTWNHDLQVGLATEIDRDEAYLSYTRSRNTILFAFSASTLLFLSIVAIVNRNRERTAALNRALGKSEELFRTVVLNANDAIISIRGREGRIVLWNKKAEEMFGYSANEVLGKNVHRLIVPERYCEKADTGVKKFLETGVGNVIGKTLEIAAMRRDGSEFPVELSIAGMKASGGWEAIATVRDITQQIEDEKKLKLAEQQIMLSEKLAGIGRLSAGVCHEILNPLNIISIQVQLMLRREKENPDLVERLTKIRGEIGRIEKIVGSLMAFSRKGTPELKPAKIDDELDLALALVEKDFNIDSIKIVRDYQSPLPEIEVDAEEMRQVFLSCISNARYEMSGGGTLTIKTRLENIDGRDHVRICFADTGSGIKKENLAKIFDPFFTTKPEGKGAGMGLSITHSIIEKHGGAITVESEEGKGATFIIDLPVKQGE